MLYSIGQHGNAVVKSCFTAIMLLVYVLLTAVSVWSLHDLRIRAQVFSRYPLIVHKYALKLIGMLIMPLGVSVRVNGSICPVID